MVGRDEIDAASVGQVRPQSALVRPPPQMKALAFADAWGGIPGVQSTLSTLLTPRVEGAQLPLPRVAALTSSNVADVFKVRGKGEIIPGADADLCLVDLSRGFELREQDLLDRHKLSPYVGQMFRGVVRRTLVRGTTVFQDGKILGKPAGRLVRPA